MCIGFEVCSVGDFNADGRDDVIAFARNTQTGAGQGDAWVALSTGTSFAPAQRWSDWICVGQEICSVGDFNADGRDDVIAFLRNTQAGAGQGDAYVALSTGTSFAIRRSGVTGSASGKRSAEWAISTARLAPTTSLPL
jgi:hypothetical protein